MKNSLPFLHLLILNFYIKGIQNNSLLSFCSLLTLNIQPTPTSKQMKRRMYSKPLRNSRIRLATKLKTIQPISNSCSVEWISLSLKNESQSLKLRQFLLTLQISEHQFVVIPPREEIVRRRGEANTPDIWRVRLKRLQRPRSSNIKEDTWGIFVPGD